MSGRMRTHAIERTSPKGEGFVGTCTLCGTPGLTLMDALKECPNQRDLSEDDALLEAISGGTVGPGSSAGEVTKEAAAGACPRCGVTMRRTEGDGGAVFYCGNPSCDGGAADG